MPNICYQKTDGEAHDLCFKEQPEAGDIIYDGYKMPDIETLHDEEFKVRGKWIDIRNKRTRLLGESDYMILADAPVDETQKQEWTTYRQALRDIPQDYDSPDEVVYPDKPE